MRARFVVHGSRPRGRGTSGFATRPYSPGTLAALGLVWVLALVFGVGAAAGFEIAAQDFSGRLTLEGRWYYQDAAHPGQESHAGGLVVEPKFYVEDAQGRSLTLAPFFRYDAADERRTHFDVREAYLLLFGDIGEAEWELRLGADRVFWGVAESRHLVDIVNQTDIVEHPNEEAKLGQPMAHLTWSGEWGAVELFALPYHRERSFPGRSGRLRSGFVVDDDHVFYESAAAEWHVDVAARYTQGFGPFDLGLSVFDGTGREPCLVCQPPRLTRTGELLLVPYYEQIRQFGMDAQLTVESWLFKLEAIHRGGARNKGGQEEDYTAFVVGGEYTFHVVFGSNADLTLLAEWNYDGRRDNATNVFDNDIFLGARLAFNDVQSTGLVASVLADADHATHSMFLELTRRLSDQWSLHIEGTFILAVDKADQTHYETRRDSFVELRVIYNF